MATTHVKGLTVRTKKFGLQIYLWALIHVYFHLEADTKRNERERDREAPQDYSEKYVLLPGVRGGGRRYRIKSRGTTS